MVWAMIRIKPHMPKILKFTKFSLWDFLVAAGPAAVGIVVTCVLAYWLVDPAPPSHVTLSTGQDNSAYAEFGKRYASALAKYGITLTLRSSHGANPRETRLVQRTDNKIGEPSLK